MLDKFAEVWYYKYKIKKGKVNQMRKFRHAITKEIITEEELFAMKEFKSQTESNFADDCLFDDWLATQGFSHVELFYIDGLTQARLREAFFEECQEYAVTDLDFEEIF